MISVHLMKNKKVVKNNHYRKKGIPHLHPHKFLSDYHRPLGTIHLSRVFCIHVGHFHRSNRSIEKHGKFSMISKDQHIQLWFFCFEYRRINI